MLIRMQPRHTDCDNIVTIVKPSVKAVDLYKPMSSGFNPGIQDVGLTIL